MRPPAPPTSRTRLAARSTAAPPLADRDPRSSAAHPACDGEPADGIPAGAQDQVTVGGAGGGVRAWITPGALAVYADVFSDLMWIGIAAGVLMLLATPLLRRLART